MAESVEGSDQQRIEQVAQQIHRWGLTLPAIVFFEIIKPFSFIASQALLVGQPLLEFFFEGQVAGYADLLADRSNVDRLVTRLEQDGSVRTDEHKERDG